MLAVDTISCPRLRSQCTERVPPFRFKAVACHTVQQPTDSAALVNNDNGPLTNPTDHSPITSSIQLTAVGGRQCSTNTLFAINLLAAGA